MFRPFWFSRRQASPALLETHREPRCFKLGSTFSKVAFLCVDPRMPTESIVPQSITLIDNYYDVPFGLLPEFFAKHFVTPTELWYPLRKAERPTSTDYDDDSDCSLEREWASPEEEDAEAKEIQPAAKPVIAFTRDAQIWGYAAHNTIARLGEDLADSKHIKPLSLILTDSDLTQTNQEMIDTTVEALKEAGVIDEPVDILTDYLTPLFKHTKSQLVQFHGLREDSTVELVLCIPPLRTEKLHQTMRTATARALQASMLTEIKRYSIVDPFLAATTSVLSDSQFLTKVKENDTVQVLHCGGCTVAVTTYTVTQTDPLRVREAVANSRGRFGSSLLNEKLTELLTTRLSDVELIGSGVSLDNVIKAAVITWENGLKHTVNVTQKKLPIDSIPIHGLAADPARRFLTNRVQIDRTELIEIFKDSLRGIKNLMRTQFQAAEEKGLSVSRVFLIGGFGESPSLKSHLHKFLRTLSKRGHYGAPRVSLSRCCTRRRSHCVARGGWSH